MISLPGLPDPTLAKNELKLNRAMEEAHSFAEMHKLIFNASKSLTTFFSTNRHLFNYQPKISMNGIQLCYVKNAKYLGYTLDQEITSNKHIQGQVIKKRRDLMSSNLYLVGTGEQRPALSVLHLSPHQTSVGVWHPNLLLCFGHHSK
ncbi:hypothetical protein TNCV_4716061 [Trichonephila clavipes]|nr:hypothetical protein TNCV_4716061 [Trichonephila clavipes]